MWGLPWTVIIIVLKEPINKNRVIKQLYMYVHACTTVTELVVMVNDFYTCRSIPDWERIRSWGWQDDQIDQLGHLEQARYVYQTIGLYSKEDNPGEAIV